MQLQRAERDLVKAFDVIDSCQTEAQLRHACRYAWLAKKALAVGSRTRHPYVFETLNQAVRDTLRRIKAAQ